MNTFSIDNEYASVEALYTLASKLSKQARNLLVRKLSKSVEEESTKEAKLSFEEAMKFLDTMSVTTHKPVPPEEDGKQLRIEKYLNL
jgi:hypothetical protein